jgi:hypothetical protein
MSLEEKRGVGERREKEEKRRKRKLEMKKQVSRGGVNR